MIQCWKIESLKDFLNKNSDLHTSPVCDPKVGVSQGAQSPRNLIPEPQIHLSIVNPSPANLPLPTPNCAGITGTPIAVS